MRPPILRDTRFHRWRSTCSVQTGHHGDGTNQRNRCRSSCSRTSPECRTPWRCSAATRDGPQSTRSPRPAPSGSTGAILKHLRKGERRKLYFWSELDSCPEISRNRIGSNKINPRRIPQPPSLQRAQIVSQCDRVDPFDLSRLNCCVSVHLVSLADCGPVR